MVYPEVPVTYWSFHHVLKFNGKKAFMPPLGLLTVAALLPGNWEIRLIDMNIEPIKDSDFTWADLIMISAMIVQKPSFSEVVRRANEHGVKIAAGGPYPTSSHESIAGVNYFILNEAESTLAEFVGDFESGSPRRLYNSSEKPSLSKTPVPRFDLIDVNAYSSMALQTSRGCPFSCEFCDIIEMFGQLPRYKSAERVIAEMDSIYATGYRGALFIVDDNFIGSKNKVKGVLKEIVLWQMGHDYPFWLYTEASINLADDEELLDMMVDAGFDTVFVGIETPDTLILESTGKVQNTKKDLKQSVRIIQSRGIEVMAGFILGFDNERDDIFERQTDFITEASIPVAMIGLMIALPQTQLYRRLASEGRIVDETSGNNTHQLELNFRTTMPEEKLIEGYKRVIKNLYNPKNYFGRAIAMIRRLPEGRRQCKKLALNDIVTFLRSLFFQIFSRYGLFYLVYILEVILHHRGHIYNAVALAVKGDHFFRISRDILRLAKTRHRVHRLLLTFEKRLAAIIQWGNGRRPLSAALRQRDLAAKKLSVFMKKAPDTIRAQSFRYCDETMTKIDALYKSFVLTSKQDTQQ